MSASIIDAVRDNEFQLYYQPKISNQGIVEGLEAGGSVALDDFGTSFSSLSYLSRIDIDTIKVDRAFIDNFINDYREKAVLNSILGLSDQLGLNICCEGVENIEQAKYLIVNKCHLMQGFYFSAPTPIEKLSIAVD